MSKKLVGSIAAVALGVSSIASSAYAAPVANPAASLSLANTARAGAPSAHKSKLAGAGIFAVLIVAGIAGIIAVAATQNGNTTSN